MALDNSVDVIIPARGSPPWLESSLVSIASQSFQPTAIILIDDGLHRVISTEDLGEKLFGRRFRLVKNAGQGISAALNTGIQQSSAHWIARMDADDVAHPNRLRQQFDFLATAPNDILGCGTQVRFINATGRVLGCSRLPESSKEIRKQLLHRTCFVHSTLMIRRDLLTTTPYRPSLDGAEDLDLLLRLSEQGGVINLNQTLLDYRIHPTQESFRARARQTAVQELAFRLCLSRQKKNVEPLEIQPELAENFIQWRLSRPGYARCRTFLTALRYMKTYLWGLDLEGFAQSALIGLKSFPINPSAVNLTWHVCWKAGAALLHQRTPFDSLNVN